MLTFSLSYGLSNQRAGRIRVLEKCFELPSLTVAWSCGSRHDPVCLFLEPRSARSLFLFPSPRLLPPFVGGRKGGRRGSDSSVSILWGAAAGTLSGEFGQWREAVAGGSRGNSTWRRRGRWPPFAPSSFSFPSCWRRRCTTSERYPNFPFLVYCAYSWLLLDKDAFSFFFWAAQVLHRIYLWVS